MDKDIRILVVDDEEAIREGLREYISLEGYRVDAAASAEEALGMDLASYDLVLLDVMMAGVDGFELARRMKENLSTARIPVIFLTARDNDDDMVAGLRLGADDYIAKPFFDEECHGQDRGGAPPGASCGAWRGVRPRHAHLPCRRLAGQASAQGV